MKARASGRAVTSEPECLVSTGEAMHLALACNRVGTMLTGEQAEANSCTGGLKLWVTEQYRC